MDNQPTDTPPTSAPAAAAPVDQPVDLAIPDEVRIKRSAPKEVGSVKITKGASVTGDQSLMIIDVLQNKPVEVFLIPVKRFAPEAIDQPLVFVQGTVSSDLLPAAQAKAKFAVKKDGTVIYNAHGFDDVVGGDFDLVDIVKLVEYNHGAGKGKRDQARKQEDATAKKQADKAATDRKQAEADRKKAAADAKAEAAAAA